MNAVVYQFRSKACFVAKYSVPLPRIKNPTRNLFRLADSLTPWHRLAPDRSKNELLQRALGVEITVTCEHELCLRSTQRKPEVQLDKPCIEEQGKG